MNLEEEERLLKERHEKELADLQRRQRLESDNGTYEDLVWQIGELKRQMKEKDREVAAAKRQAQEASRYRECASCGE